VITESIRDRILNRMLAIAGYNVTVKDVQNDPDRFLYYTMTTEQEAQWLEEGAAILVETTSLVLYRARMKMSWINLQWGLRVVPAKE